MNPVLVNVDNFVRAETERMLLSTQAEAGGINRFGHNRTPTPVEHQPVIRMNRDTLYSFAIVDPSEGATLTIPDSGDRYLSVMVVNQDRYINGIFHEPGQHSVTWSSSTPPGPASPRESWSIQPTATTSPRSTSSRISSRSTPSRRSHWR